MNSDLNICAVSDALPPTDTRQNNAHTPLPWIEMQGNIVSVNEPARIATIEMWQHNLPESKANASFIVKAVNAHDELVAVVEMMLSGDYTRLVPMQIAEAARAALARVKES